jgi:hypothetical protein
MVRIYTGSDLNFGHRVTVSQVLAQSSRRDSLTMTVHDGASEIEHTAQTMGDCMGQTYKNDKAKRGTVDNSGLLQKLKTRTFI